MKTKEEINLIKEEVETLQKKLSGLAEEEIAQATGGVICPGGDKCYHCDRYSCNFNKTPH